MEGVRPSAARQIEIELSPDLRTVGRGSVRALDVNDHIGIDGWVVGDESAPKLVEFLDESSRGFAEAAINQPRPDVSEAFPDLPGASNCGFLALLHPPEAGSSLIRLRVLFENGEKVELGTLACATGGSGPINGDSRWSSVSDDERENEKVLHGKNGWLFLRADSNNVVGQQTGAVKLGTEGQERWRQTLRARIEASRRLEVPWACLVAPDKESVYPEHLPEAIKPVERRPVHEFLEVAEELDAPVAYALDWLEPAKAYADLYATTDTHWNYRGAYIAYRAFCDQLAAQGVDLDVVEEDRLRWVDLEFEGDLGSKALPQPKVGRTVRAEVVEPESRLTFDNGVENHGWIIRYEKPAAGRTCLLFGESFSYHLLPYLKETFERLVFVHTSMFIPEVVALEKADVVLSLPLERFLIRVPDDENALEELRVTVARKGAQLPWSTAGAPPHRPPSSLFCAEPSNRSAEG
jgi:alginate O-acetyltransferase complex protein AlgJ